MTGDFPKQWAKWLSLAKYWYNTTYHSSIGMSSYQAIYGVPPPTHLPYLAGDSSNELVDRSCTNRETTIQMLKHHLHRAQNRMVQQANKRRTYKEFSVGEWVYLKLHPFRRNLINNFSLHKLAAHYFAPFKIVKKVGKVAYQLELPDNSTVHPVFHISLLKKHVGQSLPISSELPSVDGQGHFTLEPAEILARKVAKRGNLPMT